MTIKANVRERSIVVTGKEGEPIAVNLSGEGIDLVGYEKGAGGYACHDKHPSTPIEVKPGEKKSITLRKEKLPRAPISIEGA